LEPLPRCLDGEDIFGQLEQLEVIRIEQPSPFVVSGHRCDPVVLIRVFEPFHMAFLDPVTFVVRFRWSVIIMRDIEQETLIVGDLRTIPDRQLARVSIKIGRPWQELGLAKRLRQLVGESLGQLCPLTRE